MGGLIFILTILTQLTSFEITEGWELAILIFVGFPLGLYTATDPQRINRKEK
jgi:hypothetical protein